MQKVFLVISGCVKKYLFIGIMLIVVSCGEESIFYSAGGNKSAVVDDLTLIIEEEPSTPRFSDISEIETVLLMNNEERLSYEKLNGYESFYRKSIEVYKSFNFANVKSVDEIERFVAENAQYVEIFTNDNGEKEFLPKLFYNPFKYIVSGNMEFYFKDKKYNISKIEDDGVINFENMIVVYPELEEFSKFYEFSHSNKRKSAYSPCAFNSTKYEHWTDEDGPHRMECTFQIWGTGSNLLWHHRYHYSFHQRILGLWGLASGTGGFYSNSRGYTTGHTNYFEYQLLDWDSDNIVTWEHNFSTNIGQNWNFEDAVFDISGDLSTFFHSTTSYFQHDIDCMIPYYEVSFNLNGASGTPPPTQTVGYGDYAAKPSPDPNWTGYIFSGWYENSACIGSAFNFSTPIHFNRFLYAKWISCPVVTFNMNGSPSNAPLPQLVCNNGTAYKPSDPFWSGYSFIDWYTNSSGSGSPFNFSTPISSDLTLFAKWNAPAVPFGFDFVVYNKSSYTLQDLKVSLPYWFSPKSLGTVNPNSSTQLMNSNSFATAPGTDISGLFFDFYAASPGSFTKIEIWMDTSPPNQEISSSVMSFEYGNWYSDYHGNYFVHPWGVTPSPSGRLCVFITFKDF